MVFLLGGFCFIAISAGRVYLPAGKEKSHICTRSPGADEGEGAKKHSTGAGFSGNLSSKMRNYQLNPHIPAYWLYKCEPHPGPCGR